MAWRYRYFRYCRYFSTNLPVVAVVWESGMLSISLFTHNYPTNYYEIISLIRQKSINQYCSREFGSQVLRKAIQIILMFRLVRAVDLRHQSTIYIICKYTEVHQPSSSTKHPFTWNNLAKFWSFVATLVIMKRVGRRVNTKLSTCLPVCHFLHTWSAQFFHNYEAQ